MEINYIEITQPIGTFYLCGVKANQLLKMVETRRRSAAADGTQRDLSTARTQEIAKYCSDPDAVFPTPIVVSVYPNKNCKIDTEHKKIIFPDAEIIGDVVDGQHRLWGIKRSSDANLFELPVVFMFGLNTEEKAYIFSTINSNQTKVNRSLIYDLFDVATTRSPKKTVHEIARALNSEPSSPFFNRLKMLGKKDAQQDNATLSQGTFCNGLLSLISKNPDEDARNIKKNQTLKPVTNLPLRNLFIEDSDDIIAIIINNCFSALKKVFPEEWENPHNNILWKTTGFNGIIRSFPLILKKGFRQSDLSEDFFERCFYLFKAYLKKRNIKLDKNYFGGGGEQVQRKLSNLLLTSIEDINPDTMQQSSDIISYMESIPDISVYEIFDITYALTDGTAPYDTINCEKANGTIKIKHPLLAEIYSTPEARANDEAKKIEAKYMDSMDPDSWLGFMQAKEKDD